MDHFLKEVLVLLTRIAVAVEGGAAEKPKATKPKAQAEKPKATPKTTKKATPKDESPEVTKADLVTAVREKVSLNVDAVREVFKPYGTDRVSGIAEADYAEFFEKIQAITEVEGEDFTV